MKKSIIAASAASLALAAMPVVSTFAEPVDETIVDNLNVTINSTCTLTRTGADGSGDNAGEWTAGSPEATKPGTYAVTMDAGATSILGTSTFLITCNDAQNGHSLKVETTGLTSETTGATGTPINYAATEIDTTTASSWNIKLSNSGSGMPNWDSGATVTGDIVNINNGSATLYGGTAKNKTVLTNATFKATYSVGTTVSQPTGTYTGSATYTLTHGA